MRKMGLEAVYCKPRTSQPDPEHPSCGTWLPDDD